MITLQTADNALKSFYLDAVTDALNVKANPFLAKVERTSTNVVGKDVKKVIKSGVNGGFGAGTETGDLPQAGSNKYIQFTAALKNLYGTIEISDKALRASANNEGAFVNLLNEEMKSLVESASYNFGRMLFGDGQGKVGKVISLASDNLMLLDSTRSLAEGMVVSFYTSDNKPITAAQNRRLISVDQKTKTIVLDGEEVDTSVIPNGSFAYIQGSKGNELTGLEAIFASSGTLYGANRSSSVMKPYCVSGVGEFDESEMQVAMDAIEANSGSKVNMIICSWGVRRALVEYYKKMNTVLNTVELEGGFKALSYNGIPIVVDRFCPEGTMYLLNTDHFKIHQLCDWQWLEGEDGKILKQVPGKPIYTATLVKYAELICERPCAQGKLSGITEK